MKAEIELYRQVAPKVAASMVQLAVDNPGPLVLGLAGSIVLAKIAVNLVRPRNMLEAMATLIVTDLAALYLGRRALDSGLIRLRIRDDAGELVPLTFREPGEN